jgi:hypothetical protein
VVSVSRLSSGRLSIVIGNKGPGDLTAITLAVQVRDLGTAMETLTGSVTRLDAGDTMTFRTIDFAVTSDAEVVVVVDPFSTSSDPNRANNTRREIVVVPPSPTPTLEPTATPYRKPTT